MRTGAGRSRRIRTAFDASLIWKATGLTTVTLKANSEIGETTVTGASGVFRRQASVTIDHAFRRWLIGSIGISYGIEDYVGAGRRDDRLGYFAGFTYHFEPVCGDQGRGAARAVAVHRSRWRLYGEYRHAGLAAAALMEPDRAQGFVKTHSG
jgi:hypothetical protein